MGMASEVNVAAQQADLQGWVQPGLQSEFHNSQTYRETLSQKPNQSNKQENKKENHIPKHELNQDNTNGHAKLDGGKSTRYDTYIKNL